MFRHLITSNVYINLPPEEPANFYPHSVGNKARKLNKICSVNLYPNSPKSIMEHTHATTNESRLSDKVSIFSQHFQDCIY